MNSRSRSTSTYSQLTSIMPQHQQQLESKHQKLVKKVQKRTINCNKYSMARHQLKNNSQEEEFSYKEQFIPITQYTQRIRSSRQIKKNNEWYSSSNNTIQRPSTQVKVRNFKKRKQFSSPLRIIKNRDIYEQNQIKKTNLQNEENKIKTKKYLRKGTSINKAILLNILRNKFTQQIRQSLHSYGSHVKHEQLVNNLKQKIPLGLKDVVGGEQMLRMSNIFTGKSMPTVNLHQKIYKNLENIIKMSPSDHHFEDQQQTLKSIKRW